MKFFRSIVLILLLSGLFITSCSSNKSDDDIPVDKEVSIYLVTKYDPSTTGEEIVCGDALIEIKEEITADRSVLEATIRKLLEIKSENDTRNYVKGPALLLYQVTIANKVADIYLKGDFDIKELCDIARIEAQLKETAKQFDDINQANFYINNETLEHYLSVQRRSF